VQGTELFDGTVAENIAYGSKNVNRDKILEAAKLSGAHEFIMELEKGYNAVYDSKKRNFSEGQIQLILLARAFLQKKEFIIFDEATASVDVRAEQKITEALRELSKESTVIIISHRASTSVNSTQTVELN
jgi:ABC-type multidrug transport system fused ATPase/permease subunit